MFKKRAGPGGSLGFSAKIAHASIMPSLVGNKDLKLLQDFITAEKAVVVDLQKLALDYGRAAETLKSWGQGEGDDLADVLSHSAGMFMHFCDALNQYAFHEQNIRTLLKRIRSDEEDLDRLKKERRSVGSKADSAERKLQKMTPENKNIAEQTDLLTRLREEMKMLDIQILNEEARLGDFKRHTSKQLLLLKFGGLLECAEKAKVVGHFGNMVTENIPLETTLPGNSRAYYNSYDTTSKLASDASRAISEIGFEPPTVIPGGQSAPQLPHPAGMYPSEPNSPSVSQATRAPYQPSTISGYPNPGLQQGSVDEFGAATGPSPSPRFSTYQPTSYQATSYQQPTSPTTSAASPYGPPPGAPPQQPQDLGGRFATFPLPRRGLTQDDYAETLPPVGRLSSETYSSKYIPPPAPQPTHVEEPSFSESVADALAADTVLQSLGSENMNRLPTDSKSASYHTGGPIATTSAGEKSYHARAPGGAMGNDDEEETTLAYATEPNTPSPSRAEHDSVNDAYDGSTLWIRKQSDTSGALVRSPRESKEHQYAPPVPSNSTMPYHDDAAVNSAAMREVSREMDALAFNSAPRTPNLNSQAPVGTFSPPPGPPPMLQNVLRMSSRPASPHNSTTPVTRPPSIVQTQPQPPLSPPPAFTPQQNVGPSDLAPRDYVVPSSSPSSRVPSGSGSTMATASPLAPPKLNLGALSPSGGPPSPGGTRTISASAFRRPFGKKATLGLASGLEGTGATLAGPPYSSIPAGEPPVSVNSDLGPPPPLPTNMSNTSLASNGTSGPAAATNPLNIRNKPRLPSTPYPAGTLPPGAAPPRPQPNSNVSSMTDPQAFYTPNDGQGAGPGPGPGLGPGDYNFPPPSQQQQNPEGGPHSTLNPVGAAPPYSPHPDHHDAPPQPPAAVGDIPDEAEFMRELERENHENGIHNNNNNTAGGGGGGHTQGGYGSGRYATDLQ